MEAVTLSRVWDKLNFIYNLTEKPYHGSIYRKHGTLAADIARACRKRGIMYFNDKPLTPEWTWVAEMEPTKELARNILSDIQKQRQTYDLTYQKKKAVKSLHPIPMQEFPNENAPYLMETKSSTTHEKAGLSGLSKYEDKSLVIELRKRGYTVTCTKTITL